jgi:uncharacterized membrane protein
MRTKILCALIMLITVSSALFSGGWCLYIKNKCHLPLNFIVIHKDYDRDWVRNGWYQIDAYGGKNDTVCLGSSTASRIFIYAEYIDEKVFMSGKQIKYFRGKKYSFRRVYLRKIETDPGNDDYGPSYEYTFSFKCK